MHNDLVTIHFWTFVALLFALPRLVLANREPMPPPLALLEPECIP